MPEVAQRACAPRDAALGLGFFHARGKPRLFRRRKRFFRIPADRRDPLRPARPPRRPRVSPQLFPAAIVKGQTNTEDAHERLESLGVSPRLKTDASPADAFPFVVFSAPPSGSDDYAAEVRAALKAWDGTGGFVFTSSTAVYAGKDGEECDESTPEFAIGENPRADRSRVLAAVKRGELVVGFDPVENTAGLGAPA